VYGWLWRKMPGNRAEKTAGMFALVLVVLLLLFFVVFPWVEPRLPWNEVTVNSPTLTVPSSPSVSQAPSASPTG
jgi:hypothetical protein